jgi:outer membrane immunogenic protein
MRTRLVASIAVLAVLGGSALAADITRPLPVYAPAVIVPVFNWTGCYLGPNVGGIWASSKWNDPILGYFGTISASGGAGGLQAGCNYQLGSWVLGIQGDYDWTNISGGKANFHPIFAADLISDQMQIKSLTSITGRLGYSWDRFLGYVRLGGAWIKANYSFEAAGVPVATASVHPVGWTIGVGGEYAFLNWLTGFIEYDYYGFSNANTSDLVCTVAACGALTTGVRISTSVNVLKAGLNFRFGAGAF